MSIFSDIPIRLNGGAGGNKVYASWWNDLRTALINAFGSGLFPETQFTIADNQSGYQDITGLLLDSTLYRSARIEYTIYRTNGSSVERRETGYITAHYKPIAGTWTYSRRTDHGDDALNVANSLFVTTAGQVQYKSDSIGATYVGTIRYKIVIAFDKET